MATSRSTGYLVTAAVWNALHKSLTDDGQLQFEDAAELTIASDAVTVTKNYHKVDTQADAATDDLSTITAGSGVAAGFVLVLRAENVARVVTVKDSVGNILLSGDCVLSATDRTLTLLYDGTNWRELGRSVNTGAIAVASQAANDFLYASSASQLARLAAVDGKVPKYTTAGGWAMAASSPLELLKANSGTDTTTSANTVDTQAITGLTVKDTLIAIVQLTSITQATSSPQIYHATDALTLADMTASTVAAGTNFSAIVTIGCRQVGGTETVGVSFESNAGTGASRMKSQTITTDWTGSWSVGLRHTGVTSGGTLQWRWSLYVLRGQ